MRIDQLEQFIEVVKTGSINLAAQSLHLTQQSLSRSMKSLENELSVPLLTRTTKGVSLTPQGKIVLEKAKGIVHLEKQMKDELSTSLPHAESVSGEINIMYTNSFNIDKLFEAIDAFSSECPDVKIRIHCKSLPAILQGLLENRIDMGLVSMPGDYHLSQDIAGKHLRDIQMIPLYEDNLLVAVSKSSPFAKQKSISLSNVLKNPLVLFLSDSEADVGGNWLNLTLQHFGEPDFVFTTSAMDLYLDAIVNNIGMSFLTRSSAEWIKSPKMDDIILIPLRPPVKVFHSYTLNRNTKPTRATKAFIPFLEKSF